MSSFFYNLGRKTGGVFLKGKWIYQSAFGSDEEGIKAERIFGKNLAQNCINEIQVDINPTLNQLIQEIGNNLHSCLKNQLYQFDFIIQYTKDINAYAFPGGYIFITHGLLDQIKDSKDEIAFVLAHEMMHVVMGHSMGRIYSDYSTKVVTNILSRYNKFGPVARQIIGSFINSNYSQENEFEADAYGINLLNTAGYDPAKSEILLNRLKLAAPENLKILNYFNSHPPLNNRIFQIKKQILQFP